MKILARTVLVSSLFFTLTAFSNNANREDVEKVLENYERRISEDPDNVPLLYALGMAYYSIDDYQRAKELFRRALELNPSRVDVQTYLGLTYLFTDQLPESKVLLEQVVEKDPRNPDVLSALGRIYQLEYRSKESEEYYLRALELEPKNITALSFLGSLYLEQKRFSNALDIFEEIEEIAPDSEGISLDILRAKLGPEIESIKQLTRRGELQQTAALYEKLLYSHPGFVDVYLLLGEVYVRMDRHLKAIDIYQQALSLHLDPQSLRNAMGYAYLDTGNIRSARAEFSKVLDFNPFSPNALAGMGKIALIEGRVQTGKDLINKALRNRPFNLTALNYLADLQIERKRYDAAVETYKKILKIDKHAKWAQSGLLKAQYGELLEEIARKEKRKEYGAAEKLYETLIKESPHTTEFYRQYANFYYRQNAYPRAIEIYMRGLEIDPTSLELLSGLGFAYLMNGELHKSEKLFREIQQLDPINTESLVGLGAIAEFDGNWDEAEKRYLRALEIDPTNFNALLFLGQLRLKQKRYTEAERLFKMMRDPGNETEWIESLILQAKHGPILEKIEKSKEEQNFYNTERLYLQLINESPDFVDYYLELGSFYLKENRPKRAEETYLRGLSKHPESTALLTNLGLSLLEQNKLTESRLLFQTVLSEEPGNSEALTGLGRVAYKEEDVSEAEEKFHQALTYQPDSGAALTSLGKLYMDTGRYEKAEIIYERLSSLYPDVPWIKFALQDVQYAPLLEEISRMEDVEHLSEKKKVQRRMLAEALFRQLLNKAPDNPDYYLRFGLLLAEMGRFSEAINVYRQGLATAPEALSLKVAIGFSYIYQENYDAAAKEFNEVLETQHRNADALAGLGRIAELRKQHAEAEIYYRRALDINPENINALSFLGGLKVKMKKYDEARKIYERLLTLEPGKAWVKTAMAEINIAPQLARAHSLTENRDYEKAAKIYRQVLSLGNNTVDIYLSLGNAYVNMRKYDEAVRAFQEGLKKHPDSSRLYTAIGLAYALDEDTENAQKWLDRAIAETPDDAETMAGLGKVEFLKDNPNKAENLYLEALSIGPDNLAALSFYGELLMDEKRFDEAIQIYTRLIELEPQADWARRARSLAIDGPYVEGANALVDLGEWPRARQEYLNLLARSADNADYYLLLGDLYISMDQLDRGLWAYRQGLLIDPKSRSLWRSTAAVYLNMRFIPAGIFIYNCLLAMNPKDADAWAGLGRAVALTGCYCDSLNYYNYALSLDPENEDALAFMAQGEVEHERYLSARYLYQMLSCLKPEKMWIQKRLLSVHRKTRPSVTLEGRYYEEDEFENTLNMFIAKYQVYGAGARVTAPLSDCFRLSGYARQDYYRLINREQDFTYYFFDVARTGVETRWALCPNLFADMNMGISGYSPEGNGIFCQRKGVIFEPTLLFTWFNPRTRATLGFDSDTDLVGREFEKGEAKMVPRYYLMGKYEHEIYEKMNVGVEGGYYYLKGFQANYFQRAIVFVDWRPQTFRKCLSFRYFFQYQNFDKVIPEYYTYAPQLVNHLQIEYHKDICEDGLINIGYAHGWQNSRTRFAPIIVGVPPILSPMFWDRRCYNMAFLRASYDQCPIKIDLEGSFYRDSKKYTIWFINFNLGWLF